MRLILTGGASVDLVKSGRTDVAIDFGFRFVWGPLPSADELATYLAERSPRHGPGEHWSDYCGKWPDAGKARKYLGLIEFCKHCDSIELWFDRNPNDQLHLIWLLDYFGRHRITPGKLKAAVVDFELILSRPEELARWSVPKIEVGGAEFETATEAWQAYRAKTPQTCFDVLSSNLAPLPLLPAAMPDRPVQLESRREMRPLSRTAILPPGTHATTAMSGAAR